MINLARVVLRSLSGKSMPFEWSVALGLFVSFAAIRSLSLVTLGQSKPTPMALLGVPTYPCGTCSQRGSTMCLGGGGGVVATSQVAA